MSYISGSISFCGNSVNCSTQTGQIDGTASFWDSSSNCGIALLGEFYSGSSNRGIIYDAVFSDNSTNNGVVLEQVDFFENAINNNCVCGAARFYDNSSNSSSGQLAETAVFCGGAVNCGTIIGEACFYGTSSNSGVVTVAYFNESASNLGTISGSGLFFGTSVNSGIISGDAVFADTTVNNGTVEGSGSFATGASNQGGTVNGGSGVYTPPSSGLWYDDSSSLAQTVTLNGTVTQSDEGAGVIAAEFGGGYLSTSIVNDVVGDFTLDLFVKPTDNSTYRPIISLGSYADGILLRNSSNGAADNLYILGANLINGNNSYLNQNAWNHIALVRESNIFKIYVNAVYIGGNTTSTVLDFTSTFIGSAVHSSSEVFSGKIAAIRLVLGSALYSGSNITIPTSLLTAVSGTELLLNFGATAVPAVAIKNGAYSDGYFLNNSIDTSYNATTPTDAAQDDALFYTYASGVALIANGAFSNGYFVNGAIDNTYNSVTPVDTLDSGYYTFASGVATVANGAYSNGYYTSGEIDSTYNAATPTDAAQDNDSFYTYASGVATAANGYYSNGYYETGTFNNTANPGVPTQAQDDSLWYIYVSGVGTLASGAYSNGYYTIYGQIDAGYNASTPIDDAQDDDKFYTYASGVATPAWFNDSSNYQRRVVLDGTVTQSDEGGGVLIASFNDNGKFNVNSPIAAGTSDFSIAAFVKFEGGNGREDRIFNPDTSGSFAVFRNTSNQIEINNVGSGTLLASNVTITNSNWHYIYIVRTQGVATIYIDGVNRGSGSINNNFSTSSNNYIGGHAAANTFVGKIAGLHLRIGTIDIADANIPTTFPSIVTGTELLLNFATAVPTIFLKNGAYSDGYYANDYIDTSYDNTTPIQAQDDSRYYTYASGVATAAWFNDSSSSNHVVILNGTVTQSDEGSGIFAAAFDGGNNYIRTVATGSEFDFSSGDATIEFWFNPTSTAFQYLLLGQETLAVHLWPGNQMTINNGLYPDAYFGVSLDTWQHLAIVIYNGSRYVYLNGLLVATSTQLFGTTNTLYIGGANGYNGSANYNGKIAGLRIIKGSATYTSNFTPPTTLLTAISGTELLLNFGATAVPTVTNKNGAYSDGYFSNNSIDTSYNNGTPTQAQDNSKWYTYASGVATAASGAYSNGYYAAGEISSAGDTSTPTDIAQDDLLFYAYNNGVATLASGAYSNGYYTNGAFDSAYCSFSPSCTIDQPQSIRYYICGTVCDPSCEDRIFDNNIYYASFPTPYYALAKYASNTNIFAWITKDSNSFIDLSMNGTNIGWYDLRCGFYGSMTNGLGTIQCDHGITPIITCVDATTPQGGRNYYNRYSIFSNGEYVCYADGPYSNGLFSNGSLVDLTNCAGFIPTGVLDLTDCYYTYCTDDPNCWGTADNYYTNGFFIHGVKQNVLALTCQIAVNDGLCYCYCGYDVIPFNIKNGFYPDFRYVNNDAQYNRCIVNGVKTWAQVYQQNDPVVNGVANSAGWIYGDGGSGYDPYCYAYRDAVTNSNDGKAYLKHSTACCCATSNGCNGTNATWSCAYDSLCYGFTFIELKYHDTLGYQNVADTFAFTSCYYEQSCTCVSLCDQYGVITGSCYDYNSYINCCCVWFYFSNGSPDGHLKCYWNYCNGVETSSSCCRLNGDSNFSCALANFVTINYL